MTDPGDGAAEVTFALMEIGERIIGVDIASLTEAHPIEMLTPLLIEHPALLGAFRLRGHIIPLLDLTVLCGLGRDGRPPKIAAILGQGERMMALAVQSITGLARRPRAAVQRLGGEAGTAIFVGGFYDGARLINVIDPAAVFRQSGLPTAERFRREDSRLGSIGSGNAYLTFRAGGASFAAPAVEVHRTLPRQPVERNALTAGACLGSVTVGGTRIPVLDGPSVLGLGQARERADPEIVVIGYPDGRLFGLAVDVICQIASFAPSELRPPPALLGGGCATIEAVVSREPGHLTYVLRVPHLRGMEKLSSIARLSETARETGPTSGMLQGAAVVALQQERRRYLIFRAGGRYAVPIEAIVRIVEPPASVTPMNHWTPGLLGLFSVNGTTTTLVCLARHFYADPGADRDRQRVLLVRSGDEQVGFLVTSVDSIETSVWSAENVDAARHRSRMIQTGQGDARQLLPCLEIESMAQEISRQFQGESALA